MQTFVVITWMWKKFVHFAVNWLTVNHTRDDGSTRAMLAPEKWLTSGELHIADVGFRMGYDSMSDGVHGTAITFSWVEVCMCVCVCVCVCCVRACMCMYLWMHVVCVHMHMHTCMHIVLRMMSIEWENEPNRVVTTMSGGLSQQDCRPLRWQVTVVSNADDGRSLNFL